MSASRIVLVTELSGQPDEGMRKWAIQLEQALGAAGAHIERLELSGRFAALHPRTWLDVRRRRPDVIQYVPFSGLTPAALARLAALRVLCPRALASIAVLQAGAGDARYPPPLRAPHALFMSRRLRDAHHGAARATVVVPPVIDTRRFRPADRDRDELLRELDLPTGRPVVLHVGHLRRGRNLGPLIALAEAGQYAVVVVGSTSTKRDDEVVERLRTAGAHVVTTFVKNIERFYQAASIYVFPVVDARSSIEVPLSVLEAMACGTPVLATPFGGLPELFASSPSFAYADPDALPAAVERMIGAPGEANRAAVAPMTFDNLARAALASYRPPRQGRPGRAVMVALSGIDGAGKSTQVEQALAWAAERGIRAETVWCRWDPLLAKPAIKLLVRLSGGGLSSHDSGPAASAAAGDSPPSRRRALKARLLSFPLVSAGWSAMMIVDYGLRVAPRVRRARRRNDLVILDRYWHDVIVDRSAGGKLRTPPRLLRWLLPDPDAVLVLDLPEAVALARQADVPDEVYLRDRRRLYLDLVRSGAAIAIDASRPADDVTQDVLDVLEHIEHDASPIAHGGPP